MPSFFGNEKFTTDEVRKLQSVTVIWKPQLPICAVEAISSLARKCGVILPSCDDPECDHPKLPPDFGDSLRVGANMANVIRQIEEYVGL